MKLDFKILKRQKISIVKGKNAGSPDAHAGRQYSCRDKRYQSEEQSMPRTEKGFKDKQATFPFSL